LEEGLHLERTPACLLEAIQNLPYVNGHDVLTTETVIPTAEARVTLTASVVIEFWRS
jgi:protein-disulfide isomerase-like protein with CxxC motif